LSFEPENLAESFVILSEIPDYNQILNAYIVIADQIDVRALFKMKYLIKLDFLFNIISSSDLQEIHSTALQEINRSLSLGFKEESRDELDSFIKRFSKFCVIAQAIKSFAACF
jgi:hypothetical protein